LGRYRNEIVYQRTVRYLMVVDENDLLDEDGQINKVSQ